VLKPSGGNCAVLPYSKAAGFRALRLADKVQRKAKKRMPFSGTP
jgi:hypothetical protein